MQRLLGGYIRPIEYAFLAFPLIAAIFTMPFLIRNYRKYGAIPLIRALVVYSFILYMMCAFFLTQLPLPSFEEVRSMADVHPNLLPFTDLKNSLRDAGFSLNANFEWTNWALWKKYLKSGGFFQIAANVVMQIPLGIYLRYYFRASWKKTLCIGFLVSLFYETTQLTGLFFIYPKAYRLFSTDDLITNTLGAMVGFWITPIVCFLLPNRDKIEEISYRKGERVTLLRRIFAAVLDWMFFGTAEALLIWLFAANENIQTNVAAIVELLLPFVYFVLVPWLTQGYTTGKAILRLRLTSTSKPNGRGKSRLHLWQVLLRYIMIYIGIPLVCLVNMSAFLVSMSAMLYEMHETLRLILFAGGIVWIVLNVLFFARYVGKWKALPHGRISRTQIIETHRRKK